VVCQDIGDSCLKTSSPTSPVSRAGNSWSHRGSPRRSTSCGVTTRTLASRSLVVAVPGCAQLAVTSNRPQRGSWALGSWLGAALDALALAVESVERAAQGEVELGVCQRRRGPDSRRLRVLTSRLQRGGVGDRPTLVEARRALPAASLPWTLVAY
jgi:hypothetical protein